MSKNDFATKAGSHAIQIQYTLQRTNACVNSNADN